MGLHDLQAGTVVQDAAGQVWCVVKRRDDTWLIPFSDEYSFRIRADGTTFALGDVPQLPIRDTGITSSETLEIERG
jgi:hypothetical protein